MVDSSSSGISPDAITESKTSTQFVGFQLENQHYAVRIEEIQEIVILDQVTQAPQVADYVEGVTNLRGAIIPVINLRKLLGLAPQCANSETRTIVVNVGERTMGCTVDAVSQVIRIPESSIQPAPETLTGDGARDIAGFAKFDDRLFIILDLHELFDPDRMRKARAGSLKRDAVPTAAPAV